MSQYQLKHRLSTITTSAALSNVKRIKTTNDPQFTTIHESNHNIRNIQDISKNEKYRKKINNSYNNQIKDHKQSRRYSEVDWSIGSQQRNSKLRQKQVNIENPKPYKKYKQSIQYRKSEEYNHKNSNKIRIKSQFNLNNQKMLIPFLQLPKQKHKQQKFLGSDQYIQEMQKQKNKRIQQIYNPQSFSNSKILDQNKNILSVMRKNRNKAISINKFKTQQLIKLQKNNQLSYASIYQKQIQQQPNGRAQIKKLQQYGNRINIKINQADRHLLDGQSTATKITPITFQRLQHLSTIKQSNEDSKYNILQKKAQNIGSLHYEQFKKINKKTDDLPIYTKPQSPNSSQCSLPFPKFNNFFDNFNKDSIKNSQSKKQIFQNMKNHQNSQKKSPKSLNNSFIQQLNDSNLRKQKIKKLTIFNDLDKSKLKVIKNHEGVFYGEVDQYNIKNGKGAIFYHNAKIYEGQFKNNQKQGSGTQIYPDGSTYTGQYKAGKRNGKGRFQWINGQIYDGQWQNNLKHGSGLWESKQTLASYIGQWKHGVISGFGVLTNDKGQRYQGQFQNFNKEGHGALRFQNGDRLVGTFRKNQPNGECQYYWLNGDHFKGDFSNGLRHGKGVMKYRDASYFQGQFRNDKKCGLGKEQYSDNIIYYGNYQNDLRHGFGKLIYNNQVYYQGYWLNNMAVIFKQQSTTPQEIIQDEKQRLVSGFSNNLSANKLKKLDKQQQQRIIKSLKSKELLKKSKIQKFSSKNLLQRLCQPKKRCKCLVKHQN